LTIYKPYIIILNIIILNIIILYYKDV